MMGKFGIKKLIAGLLVMACAFAFMLAVSPQPNSGSGPLAGISWITGGGGAAPAEESEPEDATSDEGDELVTISDGSDGIAVEHMAGSVLVQLADGVSAEDLNAALQGLEGVADVTITEDDIVLGYVEIPLLEGMSVPDALDELEMLPVVQGSQPNFVYHMADEPLADQQKEGSADLIIGSIDAESLLKAQSSSDINDPYRNNQWALDSIYAYEAWEKVKTEGRVTVAVLDTGCNSDHPDLVNTVVNSHDGRTASSDSGTGDLNGHGTHVCGIIAAEANNGIGVAGVSYNAALLPIKVLNSSGKTSTTTLVSAYDYLIKNGPMYNVRVINMSLGYKVLETETLDGLDKDKALYNAVEKARNDGGMLTICAAGNNAASGPYLCFPGDYLAPVALNVIALEKNGSSVKRAAYSNYNAPNESTKEIAAPGSKILSTASNNDYEEKYGTSMAAPCVAGVAALVFAADPDLTPGEVEEKLLHNTTKLEGKGWSNEYGYGEVNAEAAITDLDPFLNVDDGCSPYLLLNGAMEQSTCKLIPANATETGPWVWASDNSSVASVDNNGLVTAKGAGSAVVTAKCGNDTPCRTITVYDVSFSGPDWVRAEEEIDLTFNENPNTGMWIIDSSDTSIATVNCLSNGSIRVTGVREGTATITATLASNTDLTVSYNVTVTKARLNMAKAKVSMSGWTYDGTAHKPAVTVRLDGKTIPSSDYTVSYSNNVNAGTCTATVKPTDEEKYKNVGTGTCTVSPKSLAGAVVNLSATSYAYDGSAKRPSVDVWLGSKHLKSGTDYSVSYSNNVMAGTASVTVTGRGNYKGTAVRYFTITAPKSGLVQYRTHVQNVGWQSYVRDGASSGTSGRSLRLEGINISLAAHPYSGSIRYRTHIQNIGWESGWKYDGAMSGTSGRSLRLEAIQIELTGQMAAHYDVYYRVHCQNFGWMGWAKNGAQAGSAGYAYRLEAIQIKLVPKGGSAPGSTSGAFRNEAGAQSGVPNAESNVLYRTHVQNDGWQNYMRDGEVSGTSGRSLRLEGINIKLGGNVSGGIQYRTHVQNIGWQGWRSNGAMAGTSGQSLRLEAIEIKLTGAAAQNYDVYYRVHAQNIGWMGWAKNGARAGTAGYSYRLEAIQIKLVPKGGAAPGSTSNVFRSR